MGIIGGGGKTHSKSLNTSVGVSVISAPKAGLHQCEHKLASLFCEGPDNTILDFLVKGLCDLLNSPAVA